MNRHLICLLPAIALAFLDRGLLAEDAPALNLTFTSPPGTFYSGDQADARAQTFTVRLTGMDTWKYYECEWQFSRNSSVWGTAEDTSSITTGKTLGSTDTFSWSEAGTDEEPDPGGRPWLTSPKDHSIDATVTEYEDAPLDPDDPDGDDRVATGRTGTAGAKNVYVYPFVLGVVLEKKALGYNCVG